MRKSFNRVSYVSRKHLHSHQEHLATSILFWSTKYMNTPQRLKIVCKHDRYKSTHRSHIQEKRRLNPQVVLPPQVVKMTSFNPSTTGASNQATAVSAVINPFESIQTSKFEALPQEIYNMIWEETIEGRNVQVRCRVIGEEFEIYSDPPQINVSQRSREWMKSEYNVAYLAQIRGYTGTLKPLENLWFNPKLDRICPVVERDWTPQAFKTMCDLLKLLKVWRIAVSDCSHVVAKIPNPWVTFFQRLYGDHWSSSFMESVLYTTKHDFIPHQKLEFVHYELANVELEPAQERARLIEVSESKKAFRRFNRLKNKQTRQDESNKLKGKKRTMVDGIPTWFFEEKKECPDLYLNIMLQVGSIDIWEGNLEDYEEWELEDDEEDEEDEMESEDSEEDEDEDSGYFDELANIW